VLVPLAINQGSKIMRTKPILFAFGIAGLCITALGASIWGSAHKSFQGPEQQEIAAAQRAVVARVSTGSTVQSCQRHDCDPGGIWDTDNCACEYSAILIDIRGDGFDLTNWQGGVNFSMDGRAHYSKGVWQGPRISWTTALSGDAFLFLDRNGNEAVDNSVELFGNVTPQIMTSNPNGFLALAFQDRKDHGGNADGIIDRQDAAFSKLRLWLDVNHNGISEPAEIHTLPELGIEAISLDYKESTRRDQNGNLFRFCAHVYGPKHTDLGARACEVLLRPSR